MDETMFLKNAKIKRLMIGIPKGHKHLRAVIETEGRTLVVNEAVMAAMVRAYVAVKTSPTIYAQELMTKQVLEGKPGYDRDQLVETGREQDEIRQELEDLLALDV